MKIQRIRIHLTCFLVLCVLFGQQGIINTEAKIIQPQLSSEYKQLLSYEVDKEINYPCEYLDTDGDDIVNTKISSITRNSYSGVYGYSCLCRHKNVDCLAEYVCICLVYISVVY